MILFFGIRPGTSSETLLRGIRCPHCGQSNTLWGHTIPHYFHLFWLPIFKVSTTRSAVCTHCKRMYDKQEFTREMESRFNEA